MSYNFKALELKWQVKWIENQTFKVENPNYFVLSMWPYPSGSLHMGHLRNYLLGDVIARYKTLKGFKVLHPMGWDAFGLPAENAAIEKGIHPKKWTEFNIQKMWEQLNSIGFSFDWSKEETSCLPEYYKHEQKMFLDFLKAGIAYKKASVVNWDPVDNTVLANEQVIDGKGWRSGAIVEKRLLSQWFLKISDFSSELLEGLKTLPNWPEKVKTMQENWIGRSEGAEVDFTLENSDKSIRIFTTRPETLFGASFVAVSYAHPIALGLTETEAKDFIKECEKGSTKAEDIETAEKKGFFTGLYAINPLNQERIPVYIANFVLMEYGTGAIFGCPAHDERDHVFAIKYNLPIKQVVSHPINSTNKHDEYLNGKMINSGELDDLSCIKAREKMFIKFGRKVNFRLKDWGVSRQRYWGCPIPVINCPKCKSVPVPESQLPVELPDDVKMEAGENPLKTHPTWRFVNCPNCGGKAERETDTLDTFFESSWYFLRFSGNGGSEKAFINPIKVNDYVGGIEHAILHLLYARFFTRALKKCGYPVSFEEPFERLITQGMVCHKTFQTLEGKWLTPKEASTTPPNLYTIGASIKMSKSKKNVIEPAVIVEEFGADASRLFISSDTPPERDMEWNDEGVVSSGRFLNKLFLFAQSLKDVKAKEPSVETLKILHKSIFEYEKEIEAIAFNKAIAKIRELSNQMFSISLEEAKYVIEYLTIMLLPFCPHISCEIADILNFNINSFPIVNKKFLEDKTCTISIQINGKLRGTINVSKGIPQEEISKLALLEESIKKHIAEKEIKKIIFVQDKIINFVI